MVQTLKRSLKPLPQLSNTSMGSRWEYPQTVHWPGAALEVGVNIPAAGLSEDIAALVKPGEIGECGHRLVRMVSLELSP